MPQILCIDDNTHGLTARRLLLEGMGHQVTVARSGREGLDAFRSQKIDIVIVEYRMPQMNGGEVVREIKRENPTLPVILLAGYAETLGLEDDRSGRSPSYRPRNGQDPRCHRRPSSEADNTAGA